MYWPWPWLYWRPPPHRSRAQLNPREELEALEAYRRELEEELKGVEARIEELKAMLRRGGR